jgi:multidrug efflux pump subunit AcrA (membrane-fusion protein)
VVRGLLIAPIVMSSKTCTVIRRSLMAALVVAVLIPATWFVGRNHGDVLNSSEASPAQAAAAAIKGASSERMGQIMAPDPIPVIAPVGGAVVMVSVDEGTEVKAGEVLAILAHDDTKLLAPVSGVISRRSINRGSVVRPDGGAAFHITPATPLRLVVEVDAKTSRSLRASSTASFQGRDAEADKPRAFKARFASVRAEPNGAGSLRYLASFTTEGTGAKVATGMKFPVTVNR